ncbi:hypothetical protein [Endozoicomonas acroporae]|uniref:hypothetical protein n=1 Tax=Endozoicomonas acroporae TaxID=1701104 RepID=UPI0013D7042B|nr:hypothetical protein [Endozoicomonas acroporae]
MLKIGSIRDTPSFPRTPDDEPAKKAIKKEIPDSDDQHLPTTGLVERTIASISGISSESDSSLTITGINSDSDSSSTVSGSSSESDSSSTITESSSENDTTLTITESGLGDSFLTTTGSSPESASSSTTTVSSPDSDSSLTTTSSSSESSFSSLSSSSMSEGTTFRVSNMPIDVLSQVQLLDRLSYMLSDYPELSSITRIEGIPSRGEFNTIYAKLLIQLHYENTGHDSAKIFSLIEPICKGILEKLK